MEVSKLKEIFEIVALVTPVFALPLGLLKSLVKRLFKSLTDKRCYID